jgi:hypothetical protein
MESIDKSEKWTKVLFNLTDAVEVTETAGDGQANTRNPKIEVRGTAPIRCCGREEWLEPEAL